MDWVYAGSKHEARQFMATNLRASRILDSARQIGRTQYRKYQVIHLVGTGWYRKDFEQMVQLADQFNIPIIDHTTPGIVTAPSLEIAHVYHESLGISSEWEYEGPQ